MPAALLRDSYGVADRTIAALVRRIRHHVMKARIMKEHVDTCRKLAALRQILGAIHHLHAEEYECAMTLAAAGEGMLPDNKAGKPLFRALRDRAPEENFNLFINWLKHSQGAEKAQISLFEVVLTISRAIHKFVWFYEESCGEFETFSKWAVMHGHMPRELTQEKEKEAAASVTAPNPS